MTEKEPLFGYVDIFQTSPNPEIVGGTNYVTVKLDIDVAPVYKATSQGEDTFFNGTLNSNKFTVTGMPTATGAETKDDIVVKVEADNKTPSENDEDVWEIEFWNKKNPMSGLIIGFNVNYTVDGVTKTQTVDLHGSTKASIRACLENVNTPKWQFFFRHTSPIFLEIHPVFLRKIVFAWRKNSSPLGIFPFFKRRLAPVLQLVRRTWTCLSTVSTCGLWISTPWTLSTMRLTTL